jgi:kynureninase
MKAMHAALGVITMYPIDDLRTTCIGLGDYFIEGFDTFLGGGDFSLGSRRDGSQRGGHIALLHPDAERMSKELIARGLIVDFRPPNVIRVAFSPLFLRYADVARLVGELTVLK